MQHQRLLLGIAILESIAAGCGEEAMTPELHGPPCGGRPAAAGDVCIDVGIQGCAVDFVAADGVCRPDPSLCPSGTIPKFDEGCVPVGIPSCHAGFIEADGLCRPSISSCPPGTIPDFQLGCRPVGILQCATKAINGLGICEPTTLKCANGTYALPDVGCVAGSAAGCGPDPWGNPGDGGPTIYVDPAFGGAPDGSASAPFKSIAAAMSKVEEGGRIYLAGGTYDEPIIIEKPMTIEGRCADLVKIRGVALSGDAMAVVQASHVSDVTLRELDISGPGIGIDAYAVSGLSIDHVHVHGVIDTGIRLEHEDTFAVIEGAWVEDIAPKQSGEAPRGFALEVAGHAGAITGDSAFLRGHGAGVLVRQKGSRLYGHNLVIAGTQLEPAGDHGMGAEAGDGGALFLQGTAILNNRYAGLLATGKGALVRCEGCVIEGTDVSAVPGDPGSGAAASGGGRIELEGCAVASNHGFGVVVSDLGSSGLVQGTWIAGTGEIADKEFGEGARANGGASLEITGSALTLNRSFGVAVLDAGTELTLKDTLVEGTRTDLPTHTYGAGLIVIDGARATVARAAFVKNHLAGVHVTGMGAHATVEDSLIAETQPIDDASAGRGANVQMGASLELRRSAVIENHEIAVAALSGAELDLERSLLANTAPSAKDNGLGRGLEVEESIANVECNTITRNFEGGMIVRNAGADVTSRGDVITDTEAEQKTLFRGRGVSVESGAKLDISAAFVANNRDSGVFATPMATLVASAMTIQGTRPRAVDGERGHGLACGGATCRLTGLLIEDSRVAGVMAIDGAELQVKETLIRRVPLGSFTTDFPFQSYKDIGDGLLATHVAQVTVDRLIARECARAGLMFAWSGGSISGTLSRDNMFGLGLLKEPQPEWQDGGNDFLDNSLRGVYSPEDEPVSGMSLDQEVSPSPDPVPSPGTGK
jgi:hypothetical protein